MSIKSRLSRGMIAEKGGKARKIVYSQKGPKSVIYMGKQGARPEGFEPPTFGFEGQRVGR